MLAADEVELREQLLFASERRVLEQQLETLGTLLPRERRRRRRFGQQLAAARGPRPRHDRHL
eukprot:6414297-Prymnesium_polylepis.2